MSEFSNFYDVGMFHQQFNLDNVTVRNPAGPRETSEDLLLFRIKFLREELEEFERAVGFQPAHGGQPAHLTGEPINHVQAFDALLDLAYVVFGTAHVMGYPWHAGWDEVQRANMTKERCQLDHPFQPPVMGLSDPTYVNGCYHRTNNGLCGEPRHKHSLRGNINDVIKPPGWTPPNIRAVLERFGWKF